MACQGHPYDILKHRIDKWRWGWRGQAERRTPYVYYTGKLLTLSKDSVDHTRVIHSITVNNLNVASGWNIIRNQDTWQNVFIPSSQLSTGTNAS